MKISDSGIALIKRYEGCRLKAYKPVATERYYTIGYGHYGADVKANMTITQQQADNYLRADLAKYEAYVNGYNLSWINQNRFDALVSFVYNCGAGNLKSLLNSGKRTAVEVSAHIEAYNKAGGVVLNGLVRRRKEERELFDTPVKDKIVVDTSNLSYNEALIGTYKTKDAVKMFPAVSNPVHIRILPKGVAVQCYGYYNGEWAFVKVGNDVGYVHGSYLVRG